MNNLKNYRPVSNLPFVSKIIEKVVATRIGDHLDKYKLHDNWQLLRVHHEIVAALDNNSCSILVMLDLSAAFHVIDNGIFYQSLEYTFGISGSALAWIKPYLSDRSQQIAIHWFCFVGFPRTHNWCTPRFSARTETLQHIFETNWWHLWKPRYGLSLLRRWYSNLHRSKATWQFERYVNEAHVLPLRDTRMDVFKFTKAEPGQNRAYDFCSKAQGEGTDRF